MATRIQPGTHMPSNDASVTKFGYTIPKDVEMVAGKRLTDAADQRHEPFL